MAGLRPAAIGEDVQFWVERHAPGLSDPRDIPLSRWLARFAF